MLLLPSLILVADGRASAPSQEEVVAPAGRSVADGVFTVGQARRGQRRFVQFCEACHRTRDFTNATFRDRWKDLAVGDLLRVIAETMPEDSPGSLAPEYYADVVAYLLAVSGYPEGDLELPTDPFALQDVRMGGSPDTAAAQSPPSR